MNIQRLINTTNDALTPEWLERNWRPQATVIMPPRFNHAEVTRWIAKRFSAWSWSGPREVGVMV